MQQSSQIGKPSQIQVVLQSKWKNKPLSTWNKERRTMPIHVQVFKLSERPPSWLKLVSILEALVQQRMATKEIYWDPWKQDQVNSLYGEWWTSTMILQNLRIFSQNVWNNSLIVNTILKTQTQFDIIFIQEPSWSKIRKIPSALSSKGKDLIGTTYHSNWLLFTRNPADRLDSPRVITYINICLSSLCFSLCSDIINHRDILLILFLNNYVCYYIMNIYSNSSHMALKYLKDIEVNIDNVLVMTGDFNIRDTLWDITFPHHSTISDDLMIVADSFNLVLSIPTNPCPTRYSDTVEEANLVINLMFLWYRSSKLNQHLIYPECRLSLDHVPLTIIIPITDEIVSTSTLSIPQNIKQETTFVKEIISIFKNLEMSNITDKDNLENTVSHLEALINQAWTKNAKQSRITKHSKQ